MDSRTDRSDHDLLIELNTKFENFQEQYARDIQDLKSGWAKTLNDHESRLKTVEVKVHDFDLTWKVVVTIAASVGGLVGFILSSANDLFSLVGRK